MILTLTANPSVDRTMFIDTLSRGMVIRSRRSRSEPSGKGVNVALALRRHGCPVAAVLPVGGPVGAVLSQMLDGAQLDTRKVLIAGDIRSNVTLAEPDGTITKVNAPGPALTAAEVRSLVDTVGRNLDGVTWLACCGSLPEGAPLDLYARLAELGRAHAVRVAVDSSGEALRRSLVGRPDVIKPNSHELAELVGRPLRHVGDVVDAAEEVRRRGAGSVLVSLGADGAVLVDSSGATHAEAHVDKVASAVGAGDAALAGYLSEGGAGIPALRTAVSWGAAAVQHEGTLFDGADPDQPVTVYQNLDRSRRLQDLHFTAAHRP
jgi:1-phosphofructokinase